MRWITIGLLLLGLTTDVRAAEPPLVEKYLHTGELAKGEQVLEAALAASPQDDQVRLSLGLLQVFRGVERLGQSLYEYGCRSENSNVPFLRLPVPKNPDPSPITYVALRRVLEGFRADLATAEATLAKVTDDESLKLPVRLADIHLDLDGDGRATDTLSDILKKLIGRNFEFPKVNPEFLVCLDRGDVPWLRAYCHLLMGMLELQLSADLEQQFNFNSDQMFSNPKHRFQGTEHERQVKQTEIWMTVHLTEPARLSRFRKHLLAVCDLNHESWMYIRSERDNDHEWLPNSKQKGVIGLPVSDEMIDAWLGMIDEFKGVLNGKKMIPNWVLQFIDQSENIRGRKLNLMLVLEDPPEKFSWQKIRDDGIKDKYLTRDGQDVELRAFLRVGQVFQNSFSVGYAAWFN